MTNKIPHWAIPLSPKFQAHTEKFSRKLTRIFTIIGIVSVLGISLFAYWKISRFFSEYNLRWQSPIILRTPVYPVLKTAWLLELKFATESALNPDLLFPTIEAVKLVNRPLNSIENQICETFGKACPEALRIAQCESGIDPDKVGDTHITFKQNGEQYGHSWGIFQIRYLPGRPKPAELINPDVNIQKAHEIYQANGHRFGTTSGWYNCAKKLDIL